MTEYTMSEDELLSNSLKRQVFLYRLGVPIAEPRCYMMQEIFDFLTQCKKVELFDFSEILNVCYFDDAGDLLFSTRIRSNNRDLIIGKKYCKFFTDLRKRIPPSFKSEYHYLVGHILNNLGIFFDYVLDDKDLPRVISMFKKCSHLNYMKKQYDTKQRL